MGGDLDFESISVSRSEASSTQGFQLPSGAVFLSSHDDYPGTPRQHYQQDDDDDKREEEEHVESRGVVRALSSSSSFSLLEDAEPAINKVMRNSTYGQLLRTLKSIDVHLSDLDLPLPKIVVCGDESNGKSSTVERIVTRPIFPTASGLTTRCPIYLRLKHCPDLQTQRIFLQTREAGIEPYLREVSHEEEDVAGLLKLEMDKMWDRASPISHEELVVEIHSPFVPNMDIIDLPGVVARPDSVRRETEELVKSYARDPHTIIIVVVEATAATVNNSRSLALVEMLGRQSSTILTLTKFDAVPDYEVDYKAQLLASTTMTMDTNGEEVDDEEGESGRQQQQQQLAGVVGVMNRHHTEPWSPEEARVREQERFRERLPHLRYGRDVGVDALLCKIDKLLHHHVVSKWIPDARCKVTDELDDIRRHTEELGSAPDYYCGDVSPLVKQLACGVEVLLDKLTDVCSRFMEEEGQEEGQEEGGGAIWPSQRYYDATDREQVRTRNAAQAKVRRAAYALVLRLRALVMDHTAQVLADEEPQVDNVEKLGRFPAFRARAMQVMEEAVEKLVSGAWSAISFHLDLFFAHVLFNDNDTNPYGSGGTSSSLFSAIVELVTSHFVLRLEDLFADDNYNNSSNHHHDSDDVDISSKETEFQRRMLSSVPSVGGGECELVQDLLQECPSVSARRAELLAKYDGHKRALERLERMEQTPYGQEFFE